MYPHLVIPLSIGLASDANSSPERRWGRVCTPSWAENTVRQAAAREPHLRLTNMLIKTFKKKLELFSWNNKKLAKSFAFAWIAFQYPNSTSHIFFDQKKQAKVLFFVFKKIFFMLLA